MDLICPLSSRVSITESNLPGSNPINQALRCKILNAYSSFFYVHLCVTRAEKTIAAIVLSVIRLSFCSAVSQCSQTDYGGRPASKLIRRHVNKTADTLGERGRAVERH